MEIMEDTWMYQWPHQSTDIQQCDLTLSEQNEGLMEREKQKD